LLHKTGTQPKEKAPKKKQRKRASRGHDKTCCTEIHDKQEEGLSRLLPFLASAVERAAAAAGVQQERRVKRAAAASSAAAS
jgi:hypothetical protein